MSFLFSSVLESVEKMALEAYVAIVLNYIRLHSKCKMCKGEKGNHHTFLILSLTIIILV